MSKTLWELAKSLINATLLLAAACLFLGWQLFASIGSLTGQFAQTRTSLMPTLEEIQSLRSDLSGLRDAIKTPSTQLTDPQVAAQLAALESRVAQTQAQITASLNNLDQIAIQASEAFAASLVRNVAERLQ